MAFLKKLVKLVGLLVVLLVVVGLFLPATSHVERSIKINASAEKLFPYVNDFKQFNKWSPWYGIDPNTQYTHSGPESGKGSKMSWVSDHSEVGTGSQEIILSEPNTRVQTVLDFGAQGNAEAEFLIAEAAGQSEITWSFSTDFGYNLMGRYMGVLAMEKWVGGMYEKGLNKLKTLAESE